jgi:hypothetical protein
MLPVVIRLWKVSLRRLFGTGSGDDPKPQPPLDRMSGAATELDDNRAGT